MKKTPTIFERDWNVDRSLVVNQPHPDCGWVFAGEGWPTRKIDGTCCMVRDGALYKRRELRQDEDEPEGFLRADYDSETRKTVGWLPVGDGPEDRWHREAFARWDGLKDGTYELVGPKVQGNPEGYAQHELVAHDDLALNADVPRDFDGLYSWLQHEGRGIEGLVFHHPDGRMAKIKLRDFGLMRAPRVSDEHRNGEDPKGDARIFSPKYTRGESGMSISVPKESFTAPPYIQWGHIDGPLMYWACYCHWLTYRERFALWLGLTTPEAIAHKRFGRPFNLCCGDYPGGGYCEGCPEKPTMQTEGQ